MDDVKSPSDAQELRMAPHADSQARSEGLAQVLLLRSFAAAVVLALAAFAAVGVYLFNYLNHAVAAFDSSNVEQLTRANFYAMQDILLAKAGLWKFILQSCGIMAGVAFGFLGFALFLLGVKGDMDAEYRNRQHKIQLSRMAPGTFVILMASALIGVCSTGKVRLDLNPVQTGATTTSSQPAAAAPQGTSTPAAPLAEGDPTQAEFDRAIATPSSGNKRKGRAAVTAP